MDNFDIHEWKRNQLLEKEHYPDMESGTSSVIPWDYYIDKFKWWLSIQKEKLQRVIQRTKEVYNYDEFGLKEYGGFDAALKEFFIAAAEEFGPIGLAALIGGPTAAGMMTLFKLYSWINKLSNGKIIKFMPPIKCPSCKKQQGIWPGSTKCSNPECDFNARMNEGKALSEEEAKIQDKLTSPNEFKDELAAVMQPEVDKFKPFHNAVVELTKKYPKVGLALQKAMIANTINKLPSSNEEFKSKLIDALNKTIQGKKVDDSIVNNIKNKISQL